MHIIHTTNPTNTIQRYHCASPSAGARARCNGLVSYLCAGVRPRQLSSSFDRRTWAAAVRPACEAVAHLRPDGDTRETPSPSLSFPGYLGAMSADPPASTSTTPPLPAATTLPSLPSQPVPRRLVGRGMPKKLGPILNAIVGGRLDKIAISDVDVARVRALAQQGVVVYVHRSRNPVEHLALAHLVTKHDLPRAAFVGGLNVLALQTLPRALSRLRGGFVNARRDEDLLGRCVAAGHAAELFLRRPLHLLSTSTTMRARFVEVLVRAQRTLDRPIFLVPVFLALRQRPGHFEPTAVDAILGSVEEPGLLRAIGRLAAAGDSARLEISEAVDLQAFVRDHGAAGAAGAAVVDDAPRLAKKVRWTVLHHLARVERVHHGPPLKSAARLRDDVLKDPKLQEQIAALSTSTGTPTDKLVQRAGKLHDEIAARFDVDVVRFIDRVLRAIWARIYDEIVVDDKDLDVVRAAARRGPLVIVPSHRSHVDYLVLSQVMLQKGMLPPHIAAGDNLNFFPVGPVLRRGGAFFLRRSFKGDVLYGAVFRAYVRRLFKEGFTTEFFIEGGRSRTGKTLPPKLGLLSMLVEGWLEGREDDALFVPAHIAYEKIVEQNSYTKELGGAAKKKESAAEMVKATQVLGGRYGKVFLTFETPISIKEHMQSRGVAQGHDVDDDRVRAAIAALGHRIVYGINQAGIVTAMSLVCASLIGLRKKAVDEESLLRAAQAMQAHLSRKPGARLEAGLADDGRALLLRALHKLVDDGLVTKSAIDARTLYGVRDIAWLVVDVHKNHLLHHAVPECIIAASLLAASSPADVKGGAPIDLAVVREKAKELSRVLKLEFIFKPGVAFDVLFDDALAAAAASGFVDVSTAGVVSVPATPPQQAVWRYAHQLIAGFIAAYAVVVDKVARVDGLDERAAQTTLLEAVKAAVVAGDVDAAEAASKAVVDNALAVLVERGVVVRTGKQLSLAAGKDAERQALARLLRAAC